MGGSSSKGAKSKGKGKKAGKKTDNTANGKVCNDKGKPVLVDTDNNANGEVVSIAKVETRTEEIQEECANKPTDKKGKVKKGKKDKGKKLKAKKEEKRQTIKKKKSKKRKDKKGKEKDGKNDKHKTDNNVTSVSTDKNVCEQNTEQKNSETENHRSQHFEKNSKGKMPPKVAKKDPAKRLSNCNDNSNNPSPLPKQREQERERTSQHTSPDVSKTKRSNGHVTGETEGQRALENVLTEQIRTLEQEKQSLTQDLPLLDLHQAGSDEDNYSTDDGLCYDEDGGLRYEKSTGFEESPEISKLRHLNKNRAPIQQKRKPARFSRLIPEEEIVAAGKQEKLKKDKKGSGKDKNKKDKKLKKKDSRGLSDSVAVV